MKFIANIVSTSKIDISENFNVVETIDLVIEGLPTLIIGYEYVDALFPDFDITTNRLGPNLYWTYKRLHKRDKFNEDLDFFITTVYREMIKNIVYIYVDPIQYNKSTLTKIHRKIYSIESKVGFIHKNMGYIYGDNMIFGIDFRLLEYMGVDIVKLKSRIKNNCSFFVEDANGYQDILLYLDNQIKYVPFLYSMDF